MTAIPDTGVLLERLRMAIAEAGYDWRPTFEGGYAPDGWPEIHFYGVTRLGDKAHAVIWLALKTAGFPVACWACDTKPGFDAEDACLQGNCQSPNGPARPPRELLRTV